MDIGAIGSKSVRVLIIEGSSSPPAFVRHLILGLAKQPAIELAVLAKRRAIKSLPGVKILISDFETLSGIRITFRFALECVKSPGRVLEAMRLTTPAKRFKEWSKRCYRAMLILSFDPHILHFQWATHIDTYSRLVQAGRFKCVVSLRGSQINVRPIVDPLVDELYRKLFPGCYFHAVSEAMKNKVIKYGVTEDRVKVIYSSVPQAFFDAYDESQVVPKNPLKVLSIGRYHWIKGYWYAIEAIGLLRSKGLEVSYTIVLQDGPTEEILFQIEDRGLKDHVKILNGVSHAKIVQFMKQNNVLLLPSLEEGIANVVLEAMAMGLPVITTDCGGMREIVIESETGWMVPIRNPSAMANALEKFTQLSSIEVGSVRRKAHELVKEKCSTQHNLETFCNWYRQIVEED